jgi:hypothetical protein
MIYWKVFCWIYIITFWAYLLWCCYKKNIKRKARRKMFDDNDKRTEKLGKGEML